MIRDPYYRCHECGDRLQAFTRSKMYWCEQCKARRREPNRPELMASWRWEEIQAERQAVA